MKDLEETVVNVKTTSSNLAKHFCEDQTKFQPEECFKLFADFFAKIDQAQVVCILLKSMSYYIIHLTLLYLTCFCYRKMIREKNKRNY